MFCPKCGNQLPDDAVFCASCGANVTGEPEPAYDSERGMPINFNIPQSPLEQKLPPAMRKKLLLGTSILSVISLFLPYYENFGITLIGIFYAPAWIVWAGLCIVFQVVKKPVPSIVFGSLATGTVLLGVIFNALQFMRIGFYIRFLCSAAMLALSIINFRFKKMENNRVNN